jgi:hypothetical protein
VPAVARTREQPRERREPAGHAGADDRGLPADRQHVAGDRRDHDQLGGEPRDPEQIRKPDHPEREKRDVLPRDGQEVVEAGGLEVVLELVRQALVLAEHDSGQHRPPLAFEPRGDRARDMRTQPVGDPADADTTVNHAPVTPAQDDVHAASREPAAFVESVFRTARRGDRGAEDEDGALGRRASERQLEEDALTQAAIVEAAHLGRDAQRETRRPHRPRHDSGDLGGPALLGQQQAPVERVETGTSPPPAAEQDRGDTGGYSRARYERREHTGERERGPDRRGRAQRVRGRQPQAGRDDE